MPVGSLILVETSHPGNLGAAIRLAANLGVPRVDLVRPGVSGDHPEAVRRACGGGEHVEVHTWASLAEAGAPWRTLVATASTRGRGRQPVIHPAELARELRTRGLRSAALALGNETSGLGRADLDRCDLVVTVPAEPAFPVLNVTHAAAVLLGYLSLESSAGAGARSSTTNPPADHATVGALMAHVEETLSVIGFLDRQNPSRILRKLRRLLGRAAATDEEVTILRGICRQAQWAARTRPARWDGE